MWNVQFIWDVNGGYINRFKPAVSMYVSAITIVCGIIISYYIHLCYLKENLMQDYGIRQLLCYKVRY